MPRKMLTKEEYTQGIRQLTDKDVLAHGDRIVSSPIAIAILSQREGRDIDRNILVQKMRRDQLHPMGRLGKKTFYFWRSDIENLEVEKPRNRKLGIS